VEGTVREVKRRVRVVASSYRAIDRRVSLEHDTAFATCFFFHFMHDTKLSTSFGYLLAMTAECSHGLSVKPMTDNPSSPSKKLVRETRTKNSVRMSRILARDFSRARNLFRVGHSSIPSKFLVRVSWTKNLGRLSWA